MTTSPNVPTPAGAHLARLAHRVETDPFFLAGVLRDYANASGLDEQGLANVLGCAVETLPQLALCRRPAPATCAQDVARIATRFGIDPRVLAAIVGDAR